MTLDLGKEDMLANPSSPCPPPYPVMQCKRVSKYSLTAAVSLEVGYKTRRRKD